MVTLLKAPTGISSSEYTRNVSGIIAPSWLTDLSCATETSRPELLRFSLFFFCYLSGGTHRGQEQRRGRSHSQAWRCLWRIGTYVQLPAYSHCKGREPSSTLVCSRSTCNCAVHTRRWYEKKTLLRMQMRAYLKRICAAEVEALSVVGSSLSACELCRNGCANAVIASLTESFDC